MKPALEDFLDRNLPLPGVAACSVRRADRTHDSRCYGDWFTTAQAEQILSRLASAAGGLGYHGIEPTRLCWVFEHTRIYLVLRQDGVCLALFVENQPGGADPKVIDFLAEFVRLKGV